MFVSSEEGKLMTEKSRSDEAVSLSGERGQDLVLDGITQSNQAWEGRGMDADARRLGRGRR